jgi:hypothetical protein
MQPVEIGHHQEDVAAERLQSAAGVARAVLEDGTTDLVGDARLEFLEAGVLAADALPGDEPGARPAGLERAHQLRGEPGLAHARLASQRHEAALAAVRGKERVLEDEQLLVSADERGAQHPVQHETIVPLEARLSSSVASASAPAPSRRARVRSSRA